MHHSQLLFCSGDIFCHWQRFLALFRGGGGGDAWQSPEERDLCPNLGHRSFHTGGQRQTLHRSNQGKTHMLNRYSLDLIGLIIPRLMERKGKSLTSQSHINVLQTGAVLEAHLSRWLVWTGGGGGNLNALLSRVEGVECCLQGKKWGRRSDSETVP